MQNASRAPKGKLNEMRPFAPIALAVLFVSIASLIGCGEQGVVSTPPATNRPPMDSNHRLLMADPTPTPIQLQYGTTVGTVTWPDGDTATGGQGLKVDGTIYCRHELLNKFHHHAHLSIFVDGLQLAVPRGTGMYLPGIGNSGFIYHAQCMYYIHAHDRTGIIHIEPPTDQALTLKNWFDVWGRPLNPNQIGDYQGNVAVYVNGTLEPGQDPRTVPLLPYEQITLVIGMPPTWIPSYVFPLGYP